MKIKLYKDFTIKKYVESKIREIKRQRRISNRNYLILTSLYSCLNFVTVLLAIVGIIFISKEKDIEPIFIALSSFAASIIILIFFLQIILTIFRHIMKYEEYKKILHLIQHEYFKYLEKQKEYKQINELEAKNILLKFIENLIAEKLNKTKLDNSAIKKILSSYFGEEHDKK